MKRWMAMAFAAAGLASTATSAPSWRYAVTGVTVTDLGTFGGAQSMAWDINNGGYIVGWATTAPGERHAFYYLSNASYMYDIGANSGIGQSEARGINNSKEVVGFTFNSVNLTHGFYWYAGGHVILADGTPATRTYGLPVAISDNGLIVGTRYFLDFSVLYTEATLWSDHMTFQALFVPRFPMPGYAHDVNSAGQVVGFEKYSDYPHRWQWSAAGVTDQMLVNILSGDALGINASGAVVGFDYVDGARHASLWDGVSADPLDLGVLPFGTYSYADDINNANFVAGYGDRSVSFPPFFSLTFESAFVYHAHFGKYELPKLPYMSYSNCRAHALNERQAASGLVQVVGYCNDASGNPRAVRWDVTVTAVSILPPRPPR